MRLGSGVTLRAVGPELILSQGDVLEFTGVVESFGRSTWVNETFMPLLQ
jgi:hypothetical protein